jgi:hypothetical protein
LFAGLARIFIKMMGFDGGVMFDASRSDVTP